MHQVEAKLAEASRKCSQADRRLEDAEIMEKKLHKEKLLFETEYDSCYFVLFFKHFPREVAVPVTSVHLTGPAVQERLLCLFMVQ